MPSKSCNAASASVAPVPATGCVEGRASALMPQFLRVTDAQTSASENSVLSAVMRLPMYSANASLSQRSSHHFGLTRLPNHWCAISWATVVARCTRRLRGTFVVNNRPSRNVTQPGFSMAAALKSGTKAWSYFTNGYLIPNSRWNASKHCRVIVNSSVASASRVPAIEERHNSPSGMPSCSSAIRWYGPATRVTKYVDNGRLGSNSQRPGSNSTPGAFAVTDQSSGAVTCRVYEAFRSGWSKHANTDGAALMKLIW